MAAARSRSLSLIWLSISRFCAAPGSMPSRLPIGPELADHGQLLDEVLERETLAGGQLARHGRGLVLVEGPLGLLDQGEHVAHVEDPRGHPVGVEDVEVLELLAGRRRT